MSSTLKSSFSRFPSWVPQSSAVVNSLVLLTSFSTATVGQSSSERYWRFTFMTALTSNKVLGYDASMMNALNILPSYVNYFSLTSATIGLNSGIVWIGAIFGSLAFARVPDFIGRKPALLYSACIVIIGSILQGASQHIAMFLVARFILGLEVGGTYVAGPLLIAETLPLKYRPYGLGAFTDLYYAGGLLSAGLLHFRHSGLWAGLAGITYGTAQMQSTWAWRLPSLLQVVFTIVSIMALPWIPESPRFLIHQGRQSEALLAIAQTHSNSDTSAPESQAALL